MSISLLLRLSDSKPPIYERCQNEPSMLSLVVKRKKKGCVAPNMALNIAGVFHVIFDVHNLLLAELSRLHGSIRTSVMGDGAKHAPPESDSKGLYLDERFC